MKKSIIYILMLLSWTGCAKSSEKPVGREHFTTDVLLKTTPVKNQGRSSLCWVYAMLATIETEHLMQGDSVNLSADFVARHFLMEQAAERVYGSDDGSATPPITTRGMALMTIRLMQTYGLTHFDAYGHRIRANYNVIGRKLSQLVGNRGRQPNILMADVVTILDDDIGPAPRYVYMLGAEYSALEFAHSVCRADEYESLTSFTHHPFYARFPMEVPDNRYHDTFLNVPIDTLMRSIVSALRQGHPVCWEGDVSEPGFSFQTGVARLPHDAAGQPATITQEQRQQAFESRQTTDDHCMAIVGLAHDSHGRPYFIMKNSWGTDNPYGGFMFVSSDYVRLKTIAVVLPQAACAGKR